MIATTRGLQEKLFGSQGICVPSNPAVLDFLQLEVFSVWVEIQCRQCFVCVANFHLSSPLPYHFNETIFLSSNFTQSHIFFLQIKAVAIINPIKVNKILR